MAITQNTDAYCTAADVTGRTGRAYTASSVPSLAQVEVWVKERARTINAVLKGRGYSVPIAATYTESSQVLKALNCLGAAIDADNAFPGQDGSSGRSRDWLTEWRDGLKLLTSSAFELPDAPTGTTTALAAYAQVPDGEFRLDDNDDESDPTFEMDTKW
jgi:hypothetical protein